ncbi:IclR family transcriptional regulator [Plantactinospora endophytica]|uniref:IclR family transcriptional regulator n=1 Tax=Plantactinospora endophytica TaxID=673535 RepID=UPI001EF2FD08|nr:IclR family transcriptional regulator [Plantactinospora endophytica]
MAGLSGLGVAVPDGTPSGTGSVTVRALRLLEAFTPDRRELTLTELAARAGLPLTTTHRLVNDLAGWGAVERDADGRYHIGLRLWEIASLAPRGLGLREAALPFLEDLFQVTQENVQLAVREGFEVVYVERIAGHSAVPVLTRVGGRFAMPPTGVGLVLLAHAPTDVQEAVLDAPLQRFTERTITSARELRRVLAEVRRTGIAISDRQVTMDALSIGAPVYGPTGDVVAAVSIVVRAPRPQRAGLIPVVRAAARGISRALRAPALPAARPPRRDPGPE